MRFFRSSILLGISTGMVLIWIFPVAWGLLTSFKTERDVLAYPPEVIFTPTLVNYRDVFFGGASIVPNLVSSLVVSGLTTALTMLFAIPAAYALARLDLPWKRATGFWVLATQMLPPVAAKIAANAESAVTMRRITTMTMAGRSSGSVMCRKRCQAPARSSRAAS